MSSYEILKACEKLGAQDCEVIERDSENESPMSGVATITPDGNVGCFIGNSDGSDDCILTPDEFNARFKVAAAHFDDNWY